MAATASVTIRLAPDLKESATRVAQRYGFDLTSLTRAFYRQMSVTQAIPLTLDYDEPNEESLEAIRETEEILARGGDRHLRGVGELVAALEA